MAMKPTDQKDSIVEAVAAAWAEADPGWNTAPARRELAALALDAIPNHTCRLDDGTWVAAVGKYAFDRTMETLDKVEREARR